VCRKKLQVDKATKGYAFRAHQLLMKALAEKSFPFNFVNSKDVQAYAAFVPSQRHQAPSRHLLLNALQNICDSINAAVSRKLRNAAFFGLCAGGWTTVGRHIVAVTAGFPGTSV
jgi:hypothetical protein